MRTLMRLMMRRTLAAVTVGHRQIAQQAPDALAAQTPKGAVALGGAVPHPRSVRPDDLFFSAMAAVALIAVLVGFARTYFLAGLFRAPLPNMLVHIHAAAFTSWIVLLIAQISLVAARRVDLHRRLGRRPRREPRLGVQPSRPSRRPGGDRRGSVEARRRPRIAPRRSRPNFRDRQTTRSRICRIREAHRPRDPDIRNCHQGVTNRVGEAPTRVL